MTLFCIFFNVRSSMELSGLERHGKIEYVMVFMAFKSIEAVYSVNFTPPCFGSRKLQPV